MSTLPRYVIGLDIGGTNLVGAVVESATGRLLSREDIPTESRTGVVDGLRRVSALIMRLITTAHITPQEIGGVGVGATGPFDSVGGTIKNPYNLPGWDSFPIVQHITDTFGWPCVLIGDCDVAVLGEAWQGAGRNARNVLYITVGTGIGGGVLIEGKLYRPIGSAAVEIGHHTMDMHGPKCYCGANGCWEVLASAPAIVRRAKVAFAGADPNSPLMRLIDNDLDQITAELVSVAATQGDPIAQQQVHETATIMGVGISNVMNIFGPQVVILGGGVMKGWPLFEKVVRGIIAERESVVPLHLIRLVRAELGLSAGVTGAAKAILDALA